MDVALLPGSSAPTAPKPPPGPSVFFHGLAGSACVLGNLLSYLADAEMTGYPVVPWPVRPAYQAVACATFPLLLALGLLVYRTWDPTAATWPGQSVALVVFYLCFWGFVGHVLQLLVEYDCDICVGAIGKTWPWPKFAVVERYFPSAFWVHIATAGVISLLAPLQFTARVRTWNGFLAHRWIGRVVLLASGVHQLGASYLTASNLLFNRHNAFPTSRAANRLFALGFVPFNLYASVATIQGWRTARRRRIREHTAWMYRLCAAWVIFVIEFRAVDPVVELLDEQWGLAIHMALLPLWLVPLEVYLRKRFGGTGAPGEAARCCPFLLGGD